MKPQSTFGSKPRVAVPYKPISKPSISLRNPNPDLVDKLFSVALDGDIFKIKEFIIKNNMSLYAKNEHGESILHGVIKNDAIILSDKIDFIKYLIERGAPVMAYDGLNITPLHLACKYQYPEIIDILIAAGADVNYIDNQNMTPLHYLVQGYAIECKSKKEIKVKDLVTIDKKDSIIPADETIKAINKDLIEYMYKSPLMNTYLKHMRKYINKTNELFFVDINKARADSSQQIADILQQNLSEKNKIEKISKTAFDLKTKLDKTTVDLYKKAIDPIKLSPNNEKGMGPEGDDFIVNRVIPHNSKMYYEKLEKTINGETHRNLTDFRQEFSRTRRLLSGMNDSFTTINSSIGSIIELNLAAHVNINAADESNIGNILVNRTHVRIIPAPPTAPAYISNEDMQNNISDKRRFGTNITKGLQDLNLNTNHDLFQPIDNILLERELPKNEYYRVSSEEYNKSDMKYKKFPVSDDRIFRDTRFKDTFGPAPGLGPIIDERYYIKLTGTSLTPAEKDLRNNALNALSRRYLNIFDRGNISRIHEVLDNIKYKTAPPHVPIPAGELPLINSIGDIIQNLRVNYRNEGTICAKYAAITVDYVLPLEVPNQTVIDYALLASKIALAFYRRMVILPGYGIESIRKVRNSAIIASSVGVALSLKLYSGHVPVLLNLPIMDERIVTSAVRYVARRVKEEQLKDNVKTVPNEHIDSITITLAESYRRMSSKIIRCFIISTHRHPFRSINVPNLGVLHSMPDPTILLDAIAISPENLELDIIYPPPEAALPIVPAGGVPILTPAFHYAMNPDLLRIPHEITCVSYAKYYISQMNKSFNVMNKYVEVIQTHINENHYYHICKDIIPFMVIYVCSMITNLINLQYELNNICLKPFMELETRFKTLYAKFKNYPHSFYLEHAAIESIKSSTEIKDIITKSSDFYKTNLKNIVQLINGLLTNINKKSAMEYIKTFYHSDITIANFVDTDTAHFDAMFARELYKIDDIPDLEILSDKMNKFIQLDDNDKRIEAKKTMFELLFPQIHKYNYTSYITNYIGLDFFNGPLLARGALPVDKQDRLKYEYLDNNNKNTVVLTLDVPGIQNAVIGYLLPTDKIRDFDVLLSPGVAGIKPEIKYDKTPIPGVLDIVLATLVGNIGIETYFQNRKDNTATILTVLGSNINDHIYIIRLEIIKFILTIVYHIIRAMPAYPAYLAAPNQFTPEAITRITAYNTFITTHLNPQGNDRSLIYTIVGSLADNIIVSFIKASLNKFSVDHTMATLNILHGTSYYDQILDTIKNGLPAAGPNADIVVQNHDYGFKLRLDDIIEEVTKHINTNPDKSFHLNFTSLLINDESPDLKDIHPLYNYSFTSQEAANQCYKIDASLINKLVDKLAQVNIKDIVGQTPIFYGIELQNIDVIDKLIANNATVYLDSAKNKTGATPFMFSLGMYKAHLDILDGSNNIMSSLVTPLYDTIKKKILETSTFKNNILRYSNIVLPFTLVMINHYFYSIMRNYKNKWSFEQMEELVKEIGSMNINISKDLALLNVTDDQLADIGVKGSGVLKDMIAIKGKEQADLTIINEELEIQIKSLEAELLQLRDTDNFNRITEINALLADIRGNIKARNDAKLLEANTAIDTNKDVRTAVNTRNVPGIRALINTFEMTADNRNIISLYDNIFNEITNSNRITMVDGNPVRYYKVSNTDVRTYSGLWDLYLKNPTKVNNVTNIHLSLIKYQNKIINKFNNKEIDLKTFAAKLALINNGIKVISDVCVNYQELPDDMETNFVLKDVMNILAHVLKHTLLTSFYNTIIKAITKYVKELNIYSTDVHGSIENYSRYIATIVENVVNTGRQYGGDTRSELIYYILDIMPLRLLKVSYGIYNNEYDADGTITLETIYEKITEILMVNVAQPLNEDSSLIKNLKTIISFFKEYNKMFIDEMRNLVGGYFKYIISESKMLKIMNKLIEKSIKEQTI
jgi:ankyrin repeat protein